MIFFHHSVVLSSLLFTAVNGAVLHTRRQTYCAPGESCFPNAAELAAFNQSVGGRLYAERPIGAICYPSDPLYNQAACIEQAKYAFQDQWRSDHFAS